ncbi:MAG: LysE family translocator [Alphaproteobacteria bacterium]|nr:LysE family translocator [Alphaproteobacteria bacterium]
MTFVLGMVTVEYLLTALIVVLVPGTGVIYTLSYGLFSGIRGGLLAAFGCTLGIVPHLLASVLGLAAVLHASAMAFQVVKIAGVLYLLYLAWGLWRSAGDLDLGAAGAARRSSGAIVLRGFLINILNPKLSIFFLAFLPQFVAPDVSNNLSHMTVLGVTFMALTFIVFVGYGSAAGMVRDRVLASKQVREWTQRAFALAFAGFALRLALADR